MSVLEIDMTADCKSRDSVGKTGSSIVMMALVALAFSLVYRAGHRAGIKAARARLD